MVKYLIVKNTIPMDIENGAVLNINTNNVTPYTHGFHKYPAKFIPQIPQWAINKYIHGEKNKLIIDPFCGSGTTLVESALSGNFSIGIDIDPLSVMISKVKTTNIDEQLLGNIIKWIKSEIVKKHDSLYTPECKTIDHWFTKDAIAKLSTIRTVIDKIIKNFGTAKSIIDIRDLIIICFSSIIRRVSNADNESQKTYVSHTKIKQPEEVISLFLSQLDYFSERITEFSLKKSPQSDVILSSSCQSIKDLLNGKKADLVVTSPPYIKTIDYIYNQMVELFWVGDLFQMQTQEKQNAKKTLYIGNKQISVNDFANYSPQRNSLGINCLDEKIEQIFDCDDKNGHRHSYITYKYFADMEKHFSKISECIKADAHYIMVVGNSDVSNIHFDTAGYLSIIAHRNGFELTNKWGYKIKNRFMRFDRKGRGGIINIDWVLDFKKI